MVTCNGTVYNGPGKRYGRCGRCHAIHWEKYEGDRCGRKMEPEKPKRRTP